MVPADTLSSPILAKTTFALAIAISVASATAQWLRFPEESTQRFRTLDSDRHHHLLLGTRLAVHLRRGEILEFADDLRRIRTWPPLTSVLVGLALAAFGLSLEAAVLPCVAGYALSGIFAYLLARRLAPRHGELAGLAGMTWVLASPAHRSFATDVMLESLGAALTLGALWAYSEWRVGRRSARPLGLVLTLLFFEKYNYWLLVLLAVGSVETVRRLPVLFAWLRSSAPRSLLVAAVRHPLHWVAGGLGAVLVAAAANGGWRFAVFGHEIEVSAMSLNAWTVLAWIVAARCGLGWRALRDRVDAAPEAIRALFSWHVIPVAVWFLLPKRLGWFVWFVGPFNAPVARPPLDATFDFYVTRATLDYHAPFAGWAPVTIGLAALLLAVGGGLVVGSRRARPGAGAVLALLGIGSVLCLLHPNQQGRYLFSWIPTLWILAAIGIGAPRRWVGVVLAGAVLVLLPAVFAPGYARENGHDHRLATRGDLGAIEVAGAALAPFEAGAPGIVVSNLPLAYPLEWSWHFRRPGRPAPGFVLAADAVSATGSVGAVAVARGAEVVSVVHVSADAPLSFEAVGGDVGWPSIERGLEDWEPIPEATWRREGIRIMAWRRRDR